MSDKTTQLSLQQYLEWNENKGVNPKTKRKIIINGPVYNKIKEGWDKLQKDSDFTKQECLQWLQNKSINPKTNKKIKKDGLIYETILSKCEIFEVDEKEEKEDFKYDEKEAITILCKNQKCMMKGCPWEGKYGLNSETIPLKLKKILLFLIPYLKKSRCCCFCFSHLVLFLTFVGYKTTESYCVPRDIKELNKVQNTINELEIAGKNIDVTYKQNIIKEINKEMYKKGSSIVNTGIHSLYNVFYAIKQQDSYTSIINGLNDALSIFSC